MSISPKKLPPADLIRACLEYDPNTGVLTWKKREEWTFTSPMKYPKRVVASWNAQRAGRVGFNSPNKLGYLVGSLSGMPYLAHRVIWKHVTGNEPDFIDHINGYPSDNRWDNLRSVSSSENAMNLGVSTRSSTRLMGVYWHSTQRRWMANIRAGGVLKHLGVFDTKDDAHTARLAAEAKYGYHENHGKRSTCQHIH